MNYYQSFSHYADGTWDIEFHGQDNVYHPGFVVRLFWSVNGWIFI